MKTWEITENFVFTMELKSSYRKIAQKLSQKKLTVVKAKEFYHHILAACAVKEYLEILGYQTDWEHSNFHNPVMSIFTDVVDLEIKNYGKLECRAVFENQQNSSAFKRYHTISHHVHYLPSRNSKLKYL